MKLWLISQNENNNYDTYDSAVVAAETEEEARHTYPDNWGLPEAKWNGSTWLQYLKGGRVLEYDSRTWTTPNHVKVQFLADGYEGPPGTICASFNAG